MSSDAIVVNGVSKRYAIGLTMGAKNFRESLISMIGAPFRRLRRLGGRQSAETTDFWALQDWYRT